MPKHILLLAIVAGFFIADTADAQFLRRLLGLDAPGPAFGQPFAGPQQPGSLFGPQQPGSLFGPQQLGSLFGPQQFGPQQRGPQQFGPQQRGPQQFGPQQYGQFRQPGAQFNGAQQLNRPQGYLPPGYQQLNPQQVANGQRPVAVRPPTFFNGQVRFQNQNRQVLRFVEPQTQFGRQFSGVRQTLATIQTPNGPRVVRVQIPNVVPQFPGRTAQIPQLQSQQPLVQNPVDQLAVQPTYQQPLSVGPASGGPVDPVAIDPVAINPVQDVMPSVSIPGIVQPLETHTTQAQLDLNGPALSGPALSGPALTGPAAISSNIEDTSEVIPASAVIEETPDIDPISLDDTAAYQIPELNAPSEETETNTQGAPSILKRK